MMTCLESSAYFSEGQTFFKKRKNLIYGYIWSFERCVEFVSSVAGSRFHAVMYSFVKKYQIFNSIVSFVAVYMMHMVMAAKFSAQALLHNVPMFIHIFSRHADAHIASDGKNATALPMWMPFCLLSLMQTFYRTPLATKAGSSFTIRINAEAITTILARFSHNKIVPLWHRLVKEKI